VRQFARSGGASDTTSIEMSVDRGAVDAVGDNQILDAGTVDVVLHEMPDLLPPEPPLTSMRGLVSVSVVLRCKAAGTSSPSSEALPGGLE